MVCKSTTVGHIPPAADSTSPSSQSRACEGGGAEVRTDRLERGGKKQTNPEKTGTHIITMATQQRKGR